MATPPVPGAAGLAPGGEKAGWAAVVAWGQPCSLPATLVLELGRVLFASCPMWDSSTQGWAVPAASLGEAVHPKGC